MKENPENLMFFVGLIIGAILLWYAWPFILAIAGAGLAFLIIKRNQLNNNIEQAKKALRNIREIYKGRYGTREGDPMKCFRIEDISIGGRLTDDSLILKVSVIYWNEKESDEYAYKFKDTQSTWVLGSIGAERARDEAYWQNALLETIKNFPTIFEKDSLESEVCSLMFLNLPEAQWASNAITEIQAALDPIKITYNASLTNELLQGNSKYLLKAISQLEDEISSLSQYAHDACIAMQKVYEFLSVPSSLRNFEQLNTKPLCIYSKSDEMRNKFDSAIAAKNEYDKLKT